jgi:hypothetical protein
VRVDPRGDLEQDPLRAIGHGRKLRDLIRRVDDEPADSVVNGTQQLARRPAVAVHQDPLGREADRSRHDELPFGADTQGQAFLGNPASHRAAPERLGGVGDLMQALGLGVLAAAGPDVLLVDHVRRGTELLRDHGEADAADRHRRLRGERPDAHRSSTRIKRGSTVAKVGPSASPNRAAAERTGRSLVKIFTITGTKVSWGLIMGSPHLSGLQAASRIRCNTSGAPQSRQIDGPDRSHAFP